MAFGAALAGVATTSSTLAGATASTGATLVADLGLATTAFLTIFLVALAIKKIRLERGIWITFRGFSDYDFFC